MTLRCYGPEWRRSSDLDGCRRTSRQLFSEMSNAIQVLHGVVVDKTVERRVTVRNTTGIPCCVASKVVYRNRGPELSRDAENEGGDRHPRPRKLCSVWVDTTDSRILDGEDELEVSVWAKATTWGRYEDVLIIIEINAGDVTLPAVRIPVVVTAVTCPVEFRIEPTIKFSPVDSDQRLYVKNNSEIPIQISWHVYIKSGKNKMFGAVFDTSNSNNPNCWSFRINHFHGLESPRYFLIKPLVMKLGPKQERYATIFLDRTKELSIKRDDKNMVFGKAVGIVTALEPPEEHCSREDGYALKPVVVKLCSETLHSMQPNMIMISEKNTSFQIYAAQIYESQSSLGKASRWISMLNLLRYPENISFIVDSPFTVKTLKTLRCGVRPGNAHIRVFYEDLIEIELEVKVAIKQMVKPEMPTKISTRKTVQVGSLYAVCEHSYYQPKMIAKLDVNVRFPLLLLSTNHVNFGRVIVRETMTMDVLLSTYPDEERFTVRSRNIAFTVSPADGGIATSNGPTWLTISFRPKAAKQYSSKIEISTTIPEDTIFVEVTGLGIE